MAILDSQGRLFGRVSLIDLGAGIILVAAIAGIFLSPTLTTSVAQVSGQRQSLQVDVMIRGLTARNPTALFADIEKEAKTNLIIRNQPYGQIDLVSIQPLPRTVLVPQPDGGVKALPDPRPEQSYTSDTIITLAGQAQPTPDGFVFGNVKLKVGTPIELEGKNYRFGGSVIDIRPVQP